MENQVQKQLELNILNEKKTWVEPAMSEVDINGGSASNTPEGSLYYS
ncbi:hypothetical protein [Emticicia sp. 17c]